MKKEENRHRENTIVEKREVTEKREETRDVEKRKYSERIVVCRISGVRRKKFRGVQGFGRPPMGSGGRSLPDAGEFSKICKKIFLRKLQKMHYFSIFSQKI